MTADPTPTFTEIWNSVVAELNGDLTGSTALTGQQRAWLRMVQPLVLTEGFALLSAFGVQVPPSVSSNRLLAPSLWTMFEPPAVSQLRAAIVRKEIP